MPHAEPIPIVDALVRRWVSRAWSAACLRVAGPPRLAVYAFGKHPAFADFIDVARLPPVPDAFRHFHDVLRPAVERHGGPGGPVLIAWHERGVSSVLWVQPSRDRGEETTGRFRRCPLLLGVTAAVPLAELVRYAAGRLAALADGMGTADADDVFNRINTAAAEWAAEFTFVNASVEAAPFGVAEVPEGNAVLVAGKCDRFAEGTAISTVSPATTAAWLARAAGERHAVADVIGL